MPEWSYDALLPYFKRSESWLGGQASHRGSDGPVGVGWTCRDDQSRRRYWTRRVLAVIPYSTT
jgi:choline dehydrogenase-like flavoprotein